MINETLLSQVRQAQAKFVAMAATYALGTFNDNFFKQAAMLVAVAGGRREMQGHATIVFSLPFLLFAAHAGWMADRFPKRHVVIGAKVLELLAMVVGAIGLCQMNITLMLVMLGIMGLQAALFSPALCGAIPELYPTEYVTRANATMKIAVTAAILGGVALAGMALAQTGSGFAGLAFLDGVPRGRLIVAGGVVAIALLGLAASLAVPYRPAAAPKTPFPWTGPVDTAGEFIALRHDRLLAVMVGGDLFIWFAGSLQVLLINVMGIEQLKLSEAMTSALVVAELVGVAIGGLISSKLAVGRNWYRFLVPATFVMAGVTAAVAAIPWLPAPLRLPAFFADLLAIGVVGGVILVPCESFIQVRPPAHRKGAIIAASNFAGFTGILLSGPMANHLNDHMAPTSGFAVLGGMTAAVGLIVWVLLPKTEP